MSYIYAGRAGQGGRARSESRPAVYGSRMVRYAIREGNVGEIHGKMRSATDAYVS